MDEKQIQRIMSGLKCSREEAIEIIQADKAIDRGERMDFDLDKETEKEAKKYANVREKTVRTPKKTPVRKENATKSQIIADIFAFLTEKGYEKMCNVLIKYKNELNKSNNRNK
jgi:hypothetical protein